MAYTLHLHVAGVCSSWLCGDFVMHGIEGGWA
jgi:hypothetical protein